MLTQGKSDTQAYITAQSTTLTKLLSIYQLEGNVRCQRNYWCSAVGRGSLAKIAANQFLTRGIANTFRKCSLDYFDEDKDLFAKH